MAAAIAEQGPSAAAAAAGAVLPVAQGPNSTLEASAALPDDNPLQSPTDLALSSLLQSPMQMQCD